MDKQSLIGLGLIATILGVWLYFSGPSKEQIARNKHIRDSVELAQKAIEIEEAQKIAAVQQKRDTVAQIRSLVPDSVNSAEINDKYKDFAVALKGKSETFIIENDLIKATISNKGGMIEQVELKKYTRPGQTQPLILFKKDSTNFSLKLNTYDRSRILSTDSFFLQAGSKDKFPIGVTT